MHPLPSPSHPHPPLPAPRRRRPGTLALALALALNLAALFTLLASAPQAQAQALVYSLQIQPESGGINFHFYDSGFLVVPAQGGDASFIFTIEQDGRRSYASSEGGGRYFLALRSNGQQRAVFSSLSNLVGAQAAYLIHGETKDTLRLSVNRFTVSVPVAPTLRGHLLASDDEAGAQPASDGSVGVAGSAAITARLDLTRTRQASDRALDVTATLAALIEGLEARGYTDDLADPEPGPEPGPEPQPTSP
jgi:hypothetical protein